MAVPLLAAGCGGSGGGGTTRAATSATDTTAAPAPLHAGDASAGRAVFAATCSTCHGPDGHGGGGGGDGGPDLRRRPAARSAAAVGAVVRNGVRAMPALGEQLSTQQVRDVAAYVATSVAVG